MSQYKNQKNESAGHSRARGSSRSGAKSRTSGRSSSGRSTSAGRSSSSVRSSSSRSGYSYSTRKNHRRQQSSGFVKIAAGGVLLILAITCVVLLMKGMNKLPASTVESETETTAPPETELQKPVTVDGIDITGMSREEAREAILKDFPWAMKVVWEAETYEVKDLMAEKVDLLLEDIYTGEPKESYTLDTSGLEEAAASEAAAAAAKWDVKAKNGSISSYDAASDKFLFTGAEQGRAVDQEKLAADIVSALSRKEFDAQITATVNPVEPEFSEAAAREKYKTVATVTTKTTANSKRNTNVNLAAKAVNGTVLQPGEEFSFNDVVGERTEAKGYQSAAAYSGGEVVQEIGGGVCQVSSTLYNAVVKAGLKTTVRRSHTFEPSYVTPGTDATISWGGPDYKFVNNSSTAIGIRASYYKQEMTVSIYAIPILEEGVTRELKSTKVKDLDLPAPTYEEDPTLEPGVEKVKSAGTQGSQWETRLIVKKNGEIISDEVDHTTTYKGHAPVILRNTSGTVAATESTDPTDTIVPSMGASEAGSESGTEIPSSTEAGGSQTPGTITPTQGGSSSGGNTSQAPSGGTTTTTPTAAPSDNSQAPSSQVSGAPGSDTSATTAAPGPGSPDVPVVAPNPGV